MNINEALAKLDPFDDDHWTADGAPAIAAVISIFGDKVTRKQITETDPLLTRETAGQIADATPDVPAEEPEPMSDLDKLKNEQSILEDQNVQMSQNIEETKQAVLKNNVRLDKIHDELLVLDPPMTNQQGIQAYIAASNAARAKRHGLAQRVAASLPAGMVKVQAPIDAAFANRGKKRGGGRPMR